MATISDNTFLYADKYSVGGYITPNTIDVKPGTYNVEPGYYTVRNGSVSLPAVVEGGRKNFMDVIDALFVLKPELAEAYKTEKSDGKREFHQDILAAAEAKKNTNAAEKLSDLLGLEA